MDRDIFFYKTRFSFIANSLLNEAFIAFFGLLPFILRKDLKATIFQISLFTMLKPAISLFSFYLSFYAFKRTNNLRAILLSIGLLAKIPFLFFPFFDNVWYLIFASTIYMLFSRATIPAWMEVLKLNLSKTSRGKIFSLSSAIGYGESIIIAIAIGSALDFYFHSWKIFFFITTLIGMIGIYLQWRTPIRGETNAIKDEKSSFFQPIKEGLNLLRTRPDFLHFQIGTSINGFGLMMLIPALTLFYADTLKLSHMEISVSRYIFMGFGFILFSPIWAKALGNFVLHKLTSLVCLGFGLFPIFTLLAIYNHLWLCAAFLLYGLTQAGSHLIWNMSGPIFSGEENNSAPFTSINIFMVGFRGLIAPLMGGVLADLTGPIPVLFIGIFLCFLGSWYMFFKFPEKAEEYKL